MNNLKINPIGIDEHIQRLQEKLYRKLNNDNIEGYGRVYKYVKGKKTYPAVLLNGEDYQPIVIDDSKDVIFFFADDDDTTTSMTWSKTTVDLICMVNLKKLFPEIAHRADEEFKQQVFRILKKSRFFYISEIKITKGSDALKGFDLGKDLEPYHIIKFSGQIDYQLD